MTMVRTEPCLTKIGFSLGYYIGNEIWHRNVVERNRASLLHNNHFCFIWKSEKVKFNKVIENELKPSFKIVNNFITEENINSHFE